MRTARELFAAVGEIRFVNLDGLKMPVTVTDAKEAYGRVRYLVEPIGGSGSAWKDADSLSK